MELKTYVQAKVMDKEFGHVIREYDKQEAHSFCVYLMRQLYAHWSTVITATNDTGGTSRNLQATGTMNINGAAGANTSGIVVGTGTNAVTIDDTKLQTQTTIAGGLTHLNTTMSMESPVSGTIRFVITRGFVNQTGGALDVKEIGIYAYNSAGWYFCLDRTLYECTMDDDEGMQVTYQIDLTV